MAVITHDERMRLRDLRLKKEHEDKTNAVFREAFLLYKENNIKDMNEKIIPKLVEIGDSSFIAQFAYDFPECDVNLLLKAFIDSEPFLKDSSKISDLFVLVANDNINKVNFYYIVKAILSSHFNNLNAEVDMALRFIDKYNDYFRQEQLDLILTRLICIIESASNYPFAYQLYSRIAVIPRMNFDLLLSGVFSYPNEKSITYFAQYINVDQFYKLMIEIKKRNMKNMMDYFYNYIFESIYVSSPNDFINLLFIFGDLYVYRYLDNNPNESLESLYVKSLNIEKSRGGFK